VEHVQVNTEVYLTGNVADASGFVFDASKAKKITYINHKPKDTQTICVEFEEKFPAGKHVVTVVPTTEANIMVSSFLLP
jgi:hypothetical protein